MATGQISPSNDFTNRVMADAKRRRRKIGLWNLAYMAPIALVVALLSVPFSQEAILNLTSKKHVAVSSVQQEVNAMQEVVKDLTQFEFDNETQSMIDNGRVN